MFGNGKLKATNNSLHFENIDLKKELRTKDESISALVKENNAFKKQLSILMEAEISGKEDRDSEISTLKKQLRKQNSADILVNAFEAVGIIPTEKKKDHLAEQNRLYALQQQYCQDMANVSGQHGGLFGSGSIL